MSLEAPLSASVEALEEDGRRYALEDLGTLALEAAPHRQCASVTVATDPAFPEDKFDALMANSDTFARTWRHERADKPQWSDSEFDQSLVSQAARAGWTDDELAALIREHRRSRNGAGDPKAARPDYIERTVANAREGVGASRNRGAHRSLHADEALPSEETQAEVLIRLGLEADLFTTPEGDAYATFEVDGHRETWPLRARGSAFRRQLVHRFHAQTGKPPQPNALGQALDVLDAHAHFQGGVVEVHTRVAQLDGRVYLDLADERWRAVEVDADGWRIVERPPVRFRRARGQLTLPEPMRGGSLEELLCRFLNVLTDRQLKLLIGWLIGTLTGGPYPVAALHGGQGTAKSTATRLMRRTVDPSVALTRSAPQNVRDLQIALQNSHVLALDNLSHLGEWLSDALCRVSTGSGFATRALYTDDEEAIFDATRPVVMNGIEDLAVRGDLLDRCLVVHFRPLSASERREEREVEEDFRRAHPRILGALLDAVACSLRRRDEVQLEELPRMADFARAVEAAAPALGWPEGQFLDAYAENRFEAVEVELDASPIGRALVALVRERGEWAGSPSDLLRELERRVDVEARGSKSWPNTPRGLTGQIKRLGGALRASGIEPAFGRSNDRNRTRRITLRVADGCADGLDGWPTPQPSEENCSTTRSKDCSDGSDGGTA